LSPIPLTRDYLEPTSQWEAMKMFAHLAVFVSCGAVKKMFPSIWGWFEFCLWFSFWFWLWFWPCPSSSGKRVSCCRCCCYTLLAVVWISVMKDLLRLGGIQRPPATSSLPFSQPGCVCGIPENENIFSMRVHKAMRDAQQQEQQEKQLQQDPAHISRLGYPHLYVWLPLREISTSIFLDYYK